jgi:hypothetical protein
MAGLRLKCVVGIMVSGSLLVGSTAAAAAPTVPATPQISPWATLTALTGGAPAAAVCGAAAAAAQPAPAGGCVLPAVDAPPPAPVANVPPPPPPPAGYGVAPLLLGLVAIAAAVGFWFAVKGGSHHNTPISPG